MSKIELVLFDLDGTLLDTVPLILESFKHTLRYHFNVEKSDGEILAHLGMPLKRIFEAGYPDFVEALAKTYLEFNEAKHDRYIGVFIEVPPMLEELGKKGVRTGVVTSKRRELALRGLSLFNLEKYAEIFVGMEDTEKHKPDGAPIKKALEIAGVTDGSRVLYVGDSRQDIQSAKNAGVKSAAVEWSLLTPCELLQDEPDYFLRSPMELLEYV